MPPYHTLLQAWINSSLCCDGDISTASYLLYGALIGMAIAVPVGPIAVLCMQYALSRGFRIAFFAGLGAALADTCFGIVAGLGLSMITDWIIVNKCWIQMIGGVFLCYIGAELCFTKSHKAILIDKKATSTTAMTSTFMLTLANPLTILAFLALFGYFGLIDIANNTLPAALTIIGILLGSLTWWTALAYLASRLKPHFSDKALIRFREIGGALLLMCGIFAFVSCLIFETFYTSI